MCVYLRTYLPARTIILELGKVRQEHCFCFTFEYLGSRSYRETFFKKEKSSLGPRAPNSTTLRKVFCILILPKGTTAGEDYKAQSMCTVGEKIKFGRQCTGGSFKN